MNKALIFIILFLSVAQLSNSANAESTRKFFNRYNDYIKANEYNKAEELLLDKLSDNPRINLLNFDLHRNITLGLAQVKNLKGEYEEAEKHARQSLKIFNKLQKNTGVPKSMHEIAVALHGQGKTAEAKKYLSKSFRSYKSLPKSKKIKKAMLTSLNLSAIIESDYGNYQKATVD